MNSCILHVGMPKTGSSSIQDYLGHRLGDRRFLFVALGFANSSRSLLTIAGDNPENYPMNQRRGIDRQRAATLRSHYLRQLGRSLKRARLRGQTPILSAEGCWHLNYNELSRLKQYFCDFGSAVKIVVYLRSHLPWLESNFQQQIKCGNRPIDPFNLDPVGFDDSEMNYLRNLDRLAEVFGESNLLVRLFSPSELVGGCAVRDFCSRVGIDEPNPVVPRRNDGLSLDAVRFFYACTKFGGTLVPHGLRETNALIRRLQLLPGDRLRFSASVLAPVAEHLESQRVQILRRFGVDLGGLTAPEQPVTGAICCEQDLFRFSSSSLAWLQAQAGVGPIQGQGEQAARQVAEAMNHLRRRLGRKDWRALARERLGLHGQRSWLLR
jgi:hypothetical protein